MFERTNNWEFCCIMWKFTRIIEANSWQDDTKDEHEEIGRCLSTIKIGVCYNDNYMSCAPTQAITSATYMMLMSCYNAYSKFLYYTTYK